MKKKKNYRLTKVGINHLDVLIKRYFTDRDQMDIEELRTFFIICMTHPTFKDNISMSDIETKNVERVRLYNIIDRMFERTIEKVDWI